MSTIHQIYCTHCTHGTSALERREGELADRTLGYSARSGSLEARQLRRYYRQLERYVYYYLPRDTPSEEKLRLTACSAPRRLVYHPGDGGLQVVGQVCYRQTDAQGRTGSYFAHVLFRDPADGGPPWSPLDCLTLWGAPGWVEEDSPQIPFLLSPLASLAEMLGGRRPAVDERVLLSFLVTPARGAFDDPAGVIPERWRLMDSAARQRVFLDVFHGFMETGHARRESLLLVIEPSLAALVLFGIIRLLPAGELRDALSFSTFEPSADRVGASLAATLFFDPQKSDLPPDVYRSRGFAINTFNGRRSELRRPAAPYATAIVRRLLEEGWEAVDGSLASMASAGARTVEDLDALAALDEVVPALFDPRPRRLRAGSRSTPLPFNGRGNLPEPAFSGAWRGSPMATRYLRRTLVRKLRGLGDPYRSLAAIVGGPTHLAMLELLCAGPEVPGTRGLVAFLLKRLPGERMAELLRIEGVPVEAKVDALVGYVSSHGELPPGCDYLWEKDTPALPSLLPAVLSRLDMTALESFYKRVAGEHSDEFLAYLLEACAKRQCPLGALTQVVEAMDDRAVLSLFHSQGPRLLAAYPEGEPALGARLHAMLDSLAEHPQQFPERLDLILAGRRLLPDADQDVAAAWSNCREAILEVGRLCERGDTRIFRLWRFSGRGRKVRVSPFSRSMQQLEAACLRMAQEARRAMPPDRLKDDRQGSRKEACLRQIGERLLEGRPLLPHGVWQHQALWQKIRWYFENGQWLSVPLRRMRPRGRSAARVWIILGIIGAAVLVIILLVAAIFFVGGGKGGRQGNEARGQVSALGAPLRATTRSPMGARVQQAENRSGGGTHG